MDCADLSMTLGSKAPTASSSASFQIVHDHDALIAALTNAPPIRSAVFAFPGESDNAQSVELFTREVFPAKLTSGRRDEY